MSTAIRCDMFHSIDGVIPLATCRAWIKYHKPKHGKASWLANLCEQCRRAAVAHDNLVKGARIEVL